MIILSKPKYDYSKLKELDILKSILLELGIENDFITKEILKVDITNAVPLIENYYSSINTIYEEIEILHEDLFIHYLNFLEKKYDKIPFSTNEIKINGKGIIKKASLILKDDLSIQIVDRILHKLSFTKLGEGCGYLDEVVERLFDILQRLESLWNQRIHLYENIPGVKKNKKFIKKYQWKKTKNELVRLVTKLMEMGFIDSSSPVELLIARHFDFEEKKNIKPDINTPTQKIVWLKEIKDLLYMMNFLHDKEYFEYLRNRHVILIQHFTTKEGNLDHSKIRSYSNQIKIENRYKINSTLEKILSTLS